MTTKNWSAFFIGFSPQTAISKHDVLIARRSRSKIANYKKDGENGRNGKTEMLGRVIVLNGPSSAGKSTFCKALQTTLDEYWWHVEMDAFTAMQPTWRVPDAWEPTPEERPHPSWNPDARLAGFLTGWYQCIRALALVGNNVIADAGFLKREWLHEQADALDGIAALYVGVYCPLEEVERREQARGDRKPGYARSQYDLVHRHGPYDITVDTSVLGPQEVAEVIKTALATPRVAPSAFELLRAHDRD